MISKTEYIFRYKTEIKKSREDWLEAARKERELLGQVLSFWRDLKQLRERQGYATSSIKLQIVSLPLDSSAIDWETQLKLSVKLF